MNNAFLIAINFVFATISFIARLGKFYEPLQCGLDVYNLSVFYKT